MNVCVYSFIGNRVDHYNSSTMADMNGVRVVFGGTVDWALMES